eukprot:TRINITY_DN1387_c0_g1_i1.p1 TRINITY_DN1387_c0_g1~~TRINITY_DN1387_c0_g1_i1.p1  ORF type:complete len:154 (-),score=15.50 TRINITY_DN1387_c0_g1_i1:395-856(-)
MVKGALDFAGGMVVHMSAGYSALALSILSGKREQTSGSSGPSNVGYCVLGAALLWFGWFGYNGGAAFEADTRAGLAIVSTNLSASSAGLIWGILEYYFTKNVTAVGLATGSVVGLIAMTAGCGFCDAWSSLIIGFLGGAFSYMFIRMREVPLV